MANIDEEKKKVDEIFKAERWRWHTSGKVEGGLAVLAILCLEKEERIKILARVLKLTQETATGLVNQFYEEDHYDLFDD